MKFNFIHKFGLELEGNWLTPRNDLIEDGSIRREHFKNPQYLGELVSKPFDDYDKGMAFIKDNWPDEINHKSGFHIHLSFKTIGLYSQLMRKEFYSCFIKSIDAWAKEYHCTNPLFWKRLRGEMPDYCSKNFNPEAQIKAKDKDSARNGGLRATHLNYCFGLHKTLENRLAPSFLHADTAISYATEYFKCVESYLEESNAKEKPIKIELVETNNPEEPDREGIVKIKPFKVKLQPFSLFSSDNVYKGNNLTIKPKKVRKSKISVVPLSSEHFPDSDWENLLNIKDGKVPGMYIPQPEEDRDEENF